MNYLIAYVTTAIFPVGMFAAHARGYMSGYRNGRDDAEQTATQAFARGTKAWWKETYSRN